MYKTYIETKHENRDRLDSSEMGKAGYLLTRPRSTNTAKSKYMGIQGIYSRFFQGLHVCTSKELHLNAQVGLAISRFCYALDNYRIYSK